MVLNFSGYSGIIIDAHILVRVSLEADGVFRHEAMDEPEPEAHSQNLCGIVLYFFLCHPIK